VVITAGQGKPMMHDGMAVMVLPPQGEAGPPADAGAAGAATSQPAAGAAPADKPVTEKAEQAK